ncbi:LysR family transcriptional regulator [Caenibacillus caldisaponilyticus]|uniref:LysR family transcriptional regulator n=1 Tax=Caenibacillus caldisaponilyticus TaxID=1674942 RepID=UPI0009884329|nr:LysR family transcriptional regulator [Caenibacillus caldisaponilyticus]
MDIEDLNVFRVVAKHGNISKAAEELNFVQSSVTSKIQKLEAHFQTPLFHRHRYGVSLTAAGKTLLTYAENILHCFAEAEKAIIYSGTPKGPLAIGSMETTAAVRLPLPLYFFSMNYPDVDISLKTGPTDELVASVLAYEIDGAFVAGPVHHKELSQQAVFEEELVLVAQKKGAAVNDRPDLSRSSLLVFKQGCTYRKRLEEWLRSEKIMPHKIMEFGSLDAILGCVHAGLGITLLPKSVVDRFQDRYALACYEIPEQFAKVTTFFIQRKNAAATPAMQKFLETVKDGAAMRRAG